MAAPSSSSVRAHYDAQAECLVVEVEDLHLPPAGRCVRLVHWLVDDNGNYGDHDLRLYREALVALIDDLTCALRQLEPPTEGGADDDTTDQGSSGGETAADVRAGADSREVGAVVSEVLPVLMEGGAGVPSPCTPSGGFSGARQPAYGHLGGGCYS